jgi:hypothetical protein
MRTPRRVRRRLTPRAGLLLACAVLTGALCGVVTLRAQRSTATASRGPASPAPALRPSGPTTSAVTERLETRFDAVVAPFVKTYCLECHSGRKPEAELDLSGLTTMAAAANEPRWNLILEMVESGEMPADDAEHQPTRESRADAVAWFKDFRAHEVARNAGDP